VENVRNGVWRINDLGREWAVTRATLATKDLEEIPAFVEWRTTRPTGSSKPGPKLSLEALSAKIETLLTNPSERAVQLSIFAESFDYIDRQSTDLALTHLLPDRLRLFAGRLVVLTLKGSSVWLALDDAESTRQHGALAKMKSWKWDEESYPRYRRVPSRNGYYTPSDDKNNEWPTLQRLHFTYLARVLAHSGAVDQRSVAKHEPLIAEYLASVLCRDLDFSRLPEEVDDSSGYFEGSLTRILVNKFERDRRARDECVRKKGRDCGVCGMSFAQRYGVEVGDLIHVHHLVPLSTIRQGYSPDPGVDLVPICPNCHAVIHYAQRRLMKPRTLEEVRSMLRRTIEARGGGCGPTREWS
jgi:5-methylcytosine-specific restriction protein A